MSHPMSSWSTTLRALLGVMMPTPGPGPPGAASGADRLTCWSPPVGGGHASLYAVGTLGHIIGPLPVALGAGPGDQARGRLRLFLLDFPLQVH